MGLTIKNFFKAAKHRYICRKHRLPVNQYHIAKFLPDFKLNTINSQGDKEVIWKSEAVGLAKSVASLRNTFSGHCYIVATGPSVNDINFNHLKNKTLFGVNGAIFLAERTPINFTFYAVIDTGFVKKHFALIRKVLLSDTICFFPFDVLYTICRHDPTVLNKANIYLINHTTRAYDQPLFAVDHLCEKLKSDRDMFLKKAPYSSLFELENVGFSKNLAKSFFSGATVSYAAIQMGYYLGFQTIFLLGMDLHVAKQIRFYEKKSLLNNTRVSQLKRDYASLILPSFEILKAFCQTEEANLSVYNLSAASRLPDTVIPKITLEASLIS